MRIAQLIQEGRSLVEGHPSVLLKGNGKTITLPLDKHIGSVARPEVTYVLPADQVRKAAKVLGYDGFTDRDHPAAQVIGVTGAGGGNESWDVDWGRTVTFTQL